MKTILALDEREIAAPVDLICRCLADYRDHHFKFRPAAFSEAAVEEGGVGAGTVIRARVRLGGSSHSFRARAEEPQPGKVLMQTITTFTLTPKEMPSNFD